MKKLMLKYKSVLLYLIFGVLTTAVNIVSYWLFAHPFRVPVMVSTVIAWFLSVLFAYLTNRKWVFESEAHTRSAITKEVISFFSCRIATGLVDWFCMLIFVEFLHFDDVIVKISANVVVIILNYVASKLIIFRHDQKPEKS